jgi:hypothetical protein
MSLRPITLAGSKLAQHGGAHDVLACTGERLFAVRIFGIRQDEELELGKQLEAMPPRPADLATPIPRDRAGVLDPCRARLSLPVPHPFSPGETPCRLEPVQGTVIPLTVEIPGRILYRAATFIRWAFAFAPERRKRSSR